MIRRPPRSTLFLHDALPISSGLNRIAKNVVNYAHVFDALFAEAVAPSGAGARIRDRKSTRLNSSHMSISYAVFCLKKKNDGLAAPLADTRSRMALLTGSTSY